MLAANTKRSRTQQDFDELQVTPTTSLQLISSTWRHRTILFVDIESFTQKCALMKPQLAGEWVQHLYTTVKQLCTSHNVLYIETRGDCCVCCTPALGNVQSILLLASNLERETYVTHCLRMGMCTGDVNVLEGEDFLAVFGETSELADKMQSLARPGRMMVHYSSTSQWAKETNNKKPFCNSNMEAAEYSLAKGFFIANSGRTASSP